MTDENLPRDVPYDEGVPESLRDIYIRVNLAAKVADVHPHTITRHLRMGTLAGEKMSERLWYVQRITNEDDTVPAIDYWIEGQPGNPNWKK